MWVYNSPIGQLRIVRTADGKYGLLYAGTIWEACDTAQQEADNVYCHVTGCDEWDNLDGTISDCPQSIEEWAYYPDT